MKTYLIYGILFLGWTTLIYMVARNSQRKPLQYLCIGLMVFLTVIFFWVRSGPMTSRDFNAYFHAGNRILEDPENLYSENDQVVTSFVNLPIVALLFTPFSYLDRSQAKFLFSAIGLFTILSTLFLLFRSRSLQRWRAVAIIAIFAGNGPLYNSFRIGNTTHIILLILTIVFLNLGVGRQLQAGILLAIAAIIKTPLILFAGYLALRKYWTALAGFGITFLVILAASVFLFGIPLHQTWLEKCVLSFHSKALGGFNVQSIDGFLVRFLTENNATNWMLVPIDSHFRLVRYLFVFILCFLVAAICSKSKAPTTIEQTYLELSIVLCLGLIISPVSWTHYYLFLLLPLSLCLQDRLAIPQHKIWLAVFSLVVMLVSPPVIRAPAAFKSGYSLLDGFVSRFFVSHYLIGALLFLAIQLAAARRFSMAKKT